MNTTPPRCCASSAKAARLAGLLALSVYVATAGGSLATTDAVATFEITRSIVERGAVDGPRQLMWEPNRGVDGRYYSQFGLGQSLYNVPFYVAGRTAERVLGVRVGRPDSLTKAAVAGGSAIAAAACVWFAFLLASRIGAGPAGAAFAALSLAFGTLLWPYSKFGFNAPLATACLLGATDALWRGTRAGSTRALLLGGALLGAGVFVRHESMLAALPVAAWLVMESRGRPALLLQRILVVGVPFASGVLGWMWFNASRFGRPFYTGYVPVFENPLNGLYGLLLSPGASLFLYCPLTIAAVVALVRLGRRDRATAVLFGGFVLVFLLFYATLRDWEGGRSYGPRYLVPTLPYFCIALGQWFGDASRRSARLLLAIAMLSVLVQLPGVVVDFSKVAEQEAQRTGQSHVVRHASWHSSSIGLNTAAAVAAVPRNLGFLLGWEMRPPLAPAGEDRRDFSRQFAFSLDFWWMYAFYLGAIRAPAAIACGVALLLLAGFLGLRLRVALARAPTGAPPGPIGIAPENYR
jgi:hypothetical protein